MITSMQEAILRLNMLQKNKQRMTEYMALWKVLLKMKFRLL
jgi:hypothetical protein